MFKKITKKYKIYKRNKEAKKAFRKYINENKILKLQLGASDLFLEGWFNTDLYPIRDKQIYRLDMLEKFFFEDDTFDYIFSEHNIEHFELSELYDILKECLRVLKPEGVMRVATPDLRKMLKFYLEDNNLHNEYCRWEVDNFMPFAKKVKMYNKSVVLSNFFRCWGHKVIYDYETLHKIFSDVGFKEINLCEIRKSKYHDLNDIEKHWMVTGDEFYQLETMVIEAKKS